MEVLDIVFKPALVWIAPQYPTIRKCYNIVRKLRWCRAYEQFTAESDAASPGPSPCTTCAGICSRGEQKNQQEMSSERPVRAHRLRVLTVPSHGLAWQLARLSQTPHHLLVQRKRSDLLLSPCLSRSHSLSVHASFLDCVSISLWEALCANTMVFSLLVPVRYLDTVLR